MDRVREPAILAPNEGSGGETRVIRGGAFVDPPSVLRTGNRINNSPTMRNYIVGARCARRP